jgi:tetratricopeptide (TPR) repeat protein
MTSLRPLGLIALLTLTTGLARGDERLAAARAAEAAFDPLAALEIYRELAAERPDDAFLQQRIAQQYSDSTNLLSDRAEKRRHAERALYHAQRAVALDPDDPVNVLSVAISYGKMGLYGDTREKVAFSRQLREYAERSLALDPGYAWAHHVLGRWHHEVAALSGPARLVVRLVYGGLPEASRTQAVRHLERAVALDPDNLIHHLELGIALWAVGEREAARQAFQQGLGMEETTINDAAAKRRVRETLGQLADLDLIAPGDDEPAERRT